MKLAGAYIHEDDYSRLADLAAANGRTIAGECRHLFKQALDSTSLPEKKPTLTELHQIYNSCGSLTDDEIDLLIAKVQEVAEWMEYRGDNTMLADCIRLEEELQAKRAARQMKA